MNLKNALEKTFSEFPGRDCTTAVLRFVDRWSSHGGQRRAVTGYRTYGRETDAIVRLLVEAGFSEGSGFSVIRSSLDPAVGQIRWTDASSASTMADAADAAIPDERTYAEAYCRLASGAAGALDPLRSSDTADAARPDAPSTWASYDFATAVRTAVPDTDRVPGLAALEAYARTRGTFPGAPEDPVFVPDAALADVFSELNFAIARHMEPGDEANVLAATLDTPLSTVAPAFDGYMSSALDKVDGSRTPTSAAVMYFADCVVNASDPGVAKFIVNKHRLFTYVKWVIETALGCDVVLDQTCGVALFNYSRLWPRGTDNIPIPDLVYRARHNLTNGFADFSRDVVVRCRAFLASVGPKKRQTILEHLFPDADPVVIRREDPPPAGVPGSYRSRALVFDELAAEWFASVHVTDHGYTVRSMYDEQTSDTAAESLKRFRDWRKKVSVPRAAARLCDTAATYGSSNSWRRCARDVAVAGLAGAMRKAWYVVGGDDSTFPVRTRKGAEADTPLASTSVLIPAVYSGVTGPLSREPDHGWAPGDGFPKIHVSGPGTAVEQRALRTALDSLPGSGDMFTSPSGCSAEDATLVLVAEANVDYDRWATHADADHVRKLMTSVVIRNIVYGSASVRSSGSELAGLEDYDCSWFRRAAEALSRLNAAGAEPAAFRNPVRDLSSGSPDVTVGFRRLPDGRTCIVIGISGTVARHVILSRRVSVGLPVAGAEVLAAIAAPTCTEGELYLGQADPGGPEAAGRIIAAAVSGLGRAVGFPADVGRRNSSIGPTRVSGQWSPLYRGPYQSVTGYSHGAAPTADWVRTCARSTWTRTVSALVGD